MGEYIQTEQHGPVLVIRLNRPDARNAFNKAMAMEMSAIIDSYDADCDLRAAVITAEGKTFSAGQDLIEAAKGQMAVCEKRGGFGLFHKPPEKPLIAAIEGQALAGGMELALCCDMIVASTAAIFGLAEAKRGLVAVGGGCFRLPRRVPYAVAMEMIITAEPRSAQDMAHHGLVNRVVEPGTTLEEALKIAATIARNGPLAVKAAKAIAARSVAEGWSDEQGWTLQQEIVRPVMTSADLQEGLRAFAEKRDPVWTGR